MEGNGRPFDRVRRGARQHVHNTQENRFSVLLVDDSPFATKDFPCFLRRAGCQVDVFSPRWSGLLKNQCWRGWYKGDPSHPDEWVAALAQIASQQTYDWIIPMSDAVLRMINNAVTDPELFRTLLPIAKIEHRAMLGSKAGLSELAARYGIPTPRHAVVRHTSVPPAGAAGVPFPLLIKPDGTGGGEGIVLCADEAALNAKWQELGTAKEETLVLQEYIRGENIAVEALYRDGALLGYAESAVKKTLGGEFGVSIERLYHRRAELEPILLHIGNALGLNGFVTMTFMYGQAYGKDTSGHYLIEADLRPNVWFGTCARAGVDFSAAAQHYLLRTVAGPEDIQKITAEHPVTIWSFERAVVDMLKKKDLPAFFDWCANRDGRWQDIPEDPALRRALFRYFVFMSITRLPRVAARAIRKRIRQS